MSARIYLAPAASGKTTYVLHRARETARDLRSEALILVQTAAQRSALRSQLAKGGGALGVKVEIFREFSKQILAAAGGQYTTIPTPIQHQLLRHVVKLKAAELKHYQPLVGKPGFIQELARIIHDLKAAEIWPPDFIEALAQYGAVPRLQELGLIYEAYQSQLQDLNWVDESGWAWLAVEALQKNQEELTSRWSLLVVDGFDEFPEVLLAMVEILAGRIGETIITLTGESNETGEDPARPPFQLFESTKERLEEKLGVTAEPLPEGPSGPGLPPAERSPFGHQLERNLFSGRATRLGGEDALALVAAPDRAGEVRAALRWMKERMVLDGISPQETALLARDLTTYRPFIRQTAAEFQMPVHVAGGLPLRTNPAITAIVNLLELFMPRSELDPSPALSRQGIVDAWRSPYFQWVISAEESDQGDGLSITLAEADLLDTLAREGRVIGGAGQWDELFRSIEARLSERTDSGDERVPLEQILQLKGKFYAFLELVKPPDAPRTYREFVKWLDELLGPKPTRPEPAAFDNAGPGTPESETLEAEPQRRSAAENRKAGLHLSLWEGDLAESEDIAQIDLAALRQLKEILRGMDWVEQELGQVKTITYPQFYDDLVGMIEATTFEPPEEPGADKILVSDAVGARGLRFEAVALLGLAEGEFPKVTVEDPFLWETDRGYLRQVHGLPLESSVESHEREYFYQGVTRPDKKLLLTRPRLADSGAEWQPSPFWEEIRRLYDVEPVMLTTESVPVPDRAASLAELMESLVVYPSWQKARDYVDEEQPDRLVDLNESARIMDLRYANARSTYNGELTRWRELFGDHFGPSYFWSSSSLESYHTCPFFFYVDRVLRLEPRPEPVEGLDVAQLGTIYHQILERVYQAVDPPLRRDPEKLLSVLEAIAGEILDQAPEKLGFRETAWWRETRQEIADNITRSIVAMAELPGDFVPEAFERRFFGKDALVVWDKEDMFMLRGYIDRLDGDGQGRLRLIDYKTGGPSGYTKYTLESGEKIQLPLYALAARDALELGDPVEGFYWHVQHARPSDLKLSDYGPSEAIEVAVGHAWESVRGAREGRFPALPPPNGCPSYCPAVSFCWNYRPGMWS